MIAHPSSLALEAFACGDAVPGIDEHVDVCGECKAFVAKIAEASEAFAAGPIATTRGGGGRIGASWRCRSSRRRRAS